MSISPGYHKIKTSSKKYLTLLTENGTLIATPSTGALNQVWNFQPSGNNWTIKNVGYPSAAYAYSGGQSGAPVSGNTLATEWAFVPVVGVYSIQPGSNSSNAWVVDSTNNQVKLATTQPKNSWQQFTIE